MSIKANIQKCYYSNSHEQCPCKYVEGLIQKFLLGLSPQKIWKYDNFLILYRVGSFTEILIVYSMEN